MREQLFLCDVCGRELPTHGERYTLRIERVPAFRIGGKPFDLCPQCAERMRAKLGRHEYTDVKQ